MTHKCHKTVAISVLGGSSPGSSAASTNILLKQPPLKGIAVRMVSTRQMLGVTEKGPYGPFSCAVVISLPAR